MNRFHKSSVQPTGTPMQALVQNAYGSEEVLEVAQLNKPVPGDRDVMVRIHAASLHAGDIILQRGIPYPAHFYAGWPKPKDTGASGGVGLFAVQIAKAMGAHLTGLQHRQHGHGAPPGRRRRHRLYDGSLLSLSAFVDAGELAPAIDRTYRLDQTRQAMAYVGTRQARGKVVIAVLADRTTPRRVDYD